MTNRFEGTSSHVVDNSGFIDYVRFFFSEAVTVTEIILTVFDGTNADVTYRIGSSDFHADRSGYQCAAESRHGSVADDR